MYQNGTLRSITIRGMEVSGRKAQAAANDTKILEAARQVFLADPEAPIADVAKAAGVGISALYRRYPSKQHLLHELCFDGLRRYISAAESASADSGDPWRSFVEFMQRVVEAGAASLTVRLAGTFEPSEDLYQAAAYAGELNRRIFERTQRAGAIRSDVDVNDLGLIFEQIAAVKLGDARRTSELRRRYLALTLDGLRVQDAAELPGPPPGAEELTERWNPRR